MAGKGIIIQIQGDGTGAAEALRMIEEKMRETGEAGNEMSEQLQTASERVQKALEYAGIDYGLHEALDGIKEMIQQSVDLGMEIGHLSKQTGISTENLSVLKFVSGETGVSFETLQKGFKKFSTSMLEVDMNAKQTKTALGLLGITQKDLSATGGDMYKMFELVAGKMASMPDGWQKNAAATELWGRAGAELIPVFDEVGDSMEQARIDAAALGVTLDSQGVEKMEELHREMFLVQAGLQGLSIELTSDLTPAIENWTQGMGEALAYLRDWLDLEKESSVAQRGLAAIPQDMLKSPSTAAIEGLFASGARSKAQEEIANLDKLHAEKLISEKEYREKLLQLHRDYDQATATEAAAHATALLKQLNDLENQNAGLMNHPGMDSTQAELADMQNAPILKANQQKIDALKSQQDHFLAEMLAAQARLKDDTNALGESKLGAPQEGASGKTHVIVPGSHDDAMTEKTNRDLEAAAAAQIRMQLDQDRQSEEEAQAHVGMLLQILDSEHSAGLVKDADYYAQKRALQDQEFAAEIAGLNKQKADIESAQKSMKQDDPKQLDLAQQLLAIETKITQEKDRQAVAAAEITNDIIRQQNEEAAKNLSSVMDQAQQNTPEGGGSNGRDQEARAAASTIGKMLDQISNMHGKDPLKDIVNSMIEDMDRLAVKMMEEKWILPMMQQLFGVGAGGGGGYDATLAATGASLSTSSGDITDMIPAMAGGGSPDGLTLVGEKGPELWTPPESGGTILPNDVVRGLSQGAGGGAPNVTINNINNSSQPVTMKQNGVSYDSQARQFIVHTVIEDMQQGGPVSQALRGIGGG